MREESFCVIGKEGSTKDGEGFIQRLWEEANACFSEVARLAGKNENGNIAGIYVFSRSQAVEFLPGPFISSEKRPESI